MIGVKELRVGNYVLMPSSNNFTEITPTDMYDIGLSLKNRLPIPLTEEWLLKLGFELKTSHSFHCYQLPNGWRICMWTEDKSCAGFEEGVCYWGEDFIAVRTVHHLQNLYFATTGEELTL